MSFYNNIPTRSFVVSYVFFFFFITSHGKHFLSLCIYDCVYFLFFIFFYFYSWNIFASLCGKNWWHRVHVGWWWYHNYYHVRYLRYFWFYGNKYSGQSHTLFQRTRPTVWGMNFFSILIFLHALFFFFAQSTCTCTREK